MSVTVNPNTTMAQNKLPLDSNTTGVTVSGQMKQTLAEQVKAARDALGMSQRAFAAALGLADRKQFISEVENGRKDPSRELLQAMANLSGRTFHIAPEIQE